ncbi:2-phospho-L-lactate transferase [soil metagenome]
MIVALAGGVGGAKMAHGLEMASQAPITVVVNTADDFELFGLRICPDLDTVMYTLAGLANPATGWGIEGDTRVTLDSIERFLGPSWFMVGDQDFGTHIVRSEALNAGHLLSAITAMLTESVSVRSLILPMTNDIVETIVVTPGGPLAFQDYFVRRKQQDQVDGIRFKGAGSAAALPDALNAIEHAEVVVICPSNPLVSIGPILALQGYRDALKSTVAPRIAVSPIIGGKALKGPADRMMATTGHEVSALGVARMYEGVIDGLVIDDQDRGLAAEIESLEISVWVTDSIMTTNEDRKRLGREVLDFAATMSR